MTARPEPPPPQGQVREAAFARLLRAGINRVLFAPPGPGWAQPGRRVLPGLVRVPGQGQTGLTNRYQRGWESGVGPWSESLAPTTGGAEFGEDYEPGLPLLDATLMVAAEGRGGPMAFLLAPQAGAVTMTSQYNGR